MINLIKQIISSNKCPICDNVLHINCGSSAKGEPFNERFCLKQCLCYKTYYYGNKDLILNISEYKLFYRFKKNKTSLLILNLGEIVYNENINNIDHQSILISKQMIQNYLLLI